MIITLIKDEIYNPYSCISIFNFNKKNIIKYQIDQLLGIFNFYWAVQMVAFPLETLA